MGNNADELRGTKTVNIIILVIVLLIPISIVLMWMGQYFGELREKEQEQLRFDTLTKIVAYGNSESDAAGKEIDLNLAKEVDLTTAILREYVTEEGYTGPRILDSGFIVELKGEEVILPDGIPQGELEISRDLIEKSISQGTMRSGRLNFEEAEKEADSIDPEEPVDSGYYLSFGRITDDLIYVEMTSDTDYMQYLMSYTSDGFSALKSAAELFGGMAMLVTDTDDRLKILAEYGDLGGALDLDEIGITAENIHRESFELTINGSSYDCICMSASGKWLGQENVYVMQMIPRHSFKWEVASRTIVLCFFMALVFLTMAVFLMSEKRFAQENVISGDEQDKHEPVKLRSKIINASLVGALVILVLSFLAQSVGQMYQQMRYGDDAIKLLSEKYTQTQQQKQMESIKKVKEEWYVRYCNEIAGFLEEKPEKAVQENLLDYCEILQADYIMLFDSKGKEVACSRDYEGFTMDRGLGANSSDFRRLLMGVDEIVHQPSLDSVTGLERQMIGVSMAAIDDPKKHGALVMALMPDQTTGLTGMEDWREETFLLKTEEVLCFVADSSSGEIIYSGDTSMVGQTIIDSGLSEKSLADGYMDFGTVNRTKRFILTEQSGDNTLYYTIKYDQLRNENLIVSITATVLYLVAALIMGLYLMKGYTSELFKEWSSRKIPFKGKADDILNRLFDWSNRAPEKKASLVFYIGIFIMLQLWLILILRQEAEGGSYGSLFDYLLEGKWLKGFNLLALCSILMTIAIANLIVTVAGWLLILLKGFFSAKGQTICMLFKSIIKYLAMIVVVIISLNYLGVLNPTVLGSLGIGSLALSLGAKDVVADFIAGIFIVFEETLRVGDVVEYDGKLCVVQEVGMRSTKLEYYMGNCLVISNHELTSVANLSKYNSICIIKLKILGVDSLPWLEEILARELPKMKSPVLCGPVTYIGVDELGNGEMEHKLVATTTLRIGAECDQRNMDAAKLFLNRELRLMCEREGIDLV